jgi:hypothetical protein
MKNYCQSILIILGSFLIVSCAYHHYPPEMRPYLGKNFYLTHEIYVCQIQDLITDTKDQYYIRSPNREPDKFSAICEDAIYDIGYLPKPSAWPEGRGDFRQREWLVARLPRGTRIFLKDIITPFPSSEKPLKADVIVTSGKYSGLTAQWLWFNPSREISQGWTRR